jgi:hypothetical protein
LSETPARSHQAFRFNQFAGDHNYRQQTSGIHANTASALAELALIPLDNPIDILYSINMLIPRVLTSTVVDKLVNTQKGVIIYGARQVGKTTLATTVIENTGLRALTINGDQNRFIDIISSRDLARIQSLVSGYELLFIDEAQRIPEIGINLKIILDNLPELKVLVTGSSSLDLASKISEPLTGRVWNYQLFPVSFLEMRALLNRVELDETLFQRLVYGAYPEIFSITGDRDKKEYLRNMSDAYLYRELIEFGEVKNSSKIRDLLKMLAFQIGSEVSLTELGSQLGMGKDTVDRYIDLLEKSFIIFRLKGFSRNLRKEITKMDKIYFHDLGIRNVLIDNLKAIPDRDDLGKLWENFLLVERMKYMQYTRRLYSPYFWRTYTGAELDYIEEQAGSLAGFEFKYSPRGSRIPATFSAAYPNSSFAEISRANYLDFILQD